MNATLAHPLLRVVALAATCALAVSCRSSFDDAYAEAMARNLEDQDRTARGTERVVGRSPSTDIVTEDRTYRTRGGELDVQHGEQRTWYPGGAPETLRSFDEGKPVGVWWSWWRTGALRSTYVFDPNRVTRMCWWHPNGLLASDGLARDGARTGEWTFWHENGELESRGSFKGGKRDGAWTFYDADGEWTERGSFVRGSRTGSWERRDGTMTGAVAR